MITSTLRPGLLVSLKTSCRGNATYLKKTLEDDHVTDEGSRKAAWETTRIIADPVEHDAAHKVRSKARSLISSVCANSAFGLLCPENRGDELEQMIAEARKLADDFNASAKLSRVFVYVIAGRIAPDDVEAVKAINSEVSDLLSEMQEGLKNLDVKVVRDAASRARSIGMMLAPDAQARITVAIEAARSAARKITAAGETGAKEIDKRAISLITESRTAFLDLDEQGEIAKPAAAVRAVDLDPSVKAASDAYIAKAQAEVGEPVKVAKPKTAKRAALDL